MRGLQWLRCGPPPYWLLCGGSLAAPWALGVLLLTAQAAEDASGPCVLAALLLAAASALIAALTRAELQCPGPACGSAVPGAKPLLPRAPAGGRRHCPAHAAALAAAAAEGAPHPGRAERLLVGFVPLWCGLLCGVACAAAASRALSAAMDYIAGRRGRNWLLARVGPLPEALGGALPDPLAAAVALAPHALCALGLERSWGLRLLLNMGVASALVFFVSLGAAQADPSNWAAVPANSAVGWAALLPCAALLTAGFLGYAGAVGEPPQASPAARALRALAALLAALFSYIALAVVLTMMVGYRGLSGSEVPLLRAFELRDVGWARLVMAVLSVMGLALALVELAAPAHLAIVTLAGEQWRVLPRGLSRDSALTGAPAAACAAAGAAAAALALLCPLRSLLRLGAGAALAERVAAAGALLLRRFRPDGEGDAEAEDGGPRYRRLGSRSGRAPGATATAPAPPGCPACDAADDEDGDEEVPKRHRLTVRCLKSGLGFLPAALRQTRPQHYYTSLSSASPEPGDLPAAAGAIAVRPDGRGALAAGYRGSGRMRRDAADEELLLSSPGDAAPMLEDVLLTANGTAMCNGSAVATGEGATTVSLGGSLLSEDEDDEDETDESEEEEDEAERDSSTDIDAVVAEYKEKIKVATVTSPTSPTGPGLPGLGGDPARRPSEATFRRAAMALSAAVLCFALGAWASAALPSRVAGAWCGVAGALLGGIVLAAAARQPRAPRPNTRCGHRLLPAVPWLPAAALALDLALCAHAVRGGAWGALLAWTAVGALLLWRTRGACGPCGARGCCGGGRASTRSAGRGVGRGAGGGGSRKERIRLHAPPRHSTRCTLVPSHQRLPDERARRLTQVDTILISR